MSGLARAALVFSEGFETPAVNGGDATPTDATSVSGNLLIYDNANYGAPATEGKQFLVTNPVDGPSGGSISYAFSVGVGTYTLTFDNRQYGAITQKLGVSVAGGTSTLTTPLADTVTNTAAGAPGPVQKFSDTFTSATAGTVTLTLTDNTANAPGNGSDLLIDNIQVNGPALPEPIAASFVAAIGTCALVMRRRRRAV